MVGGGNTGYQIASEFAGTHQAHLAAGTPQRPIPQLLLRRDIFDCFEAAQSMKVTTDTVRSCGRSDLGLRDELLDEREVGSCLESFADTDA